MNKIIRIDIEGIKGSNLSTCSSSLIKNINHNKVITNVSRSENFKLTYFESSDPFTQIPLKNKKLESYIKYSCFLNNFLSRHCERNNFEKHLIDKSFETKISVQENGWLYYTSEIYINNNFIEDKEQCNYIVENNLDVLPDIIIYLDTPISLASSNLANYCMSNFEKPEHFFQQISNEEKRKYIYENYLLEKYEEKVKIEKINLSKDIDYQIKNIISKYNID